MVSEVKDLTPLFSSTVIPNPLIFRSTEMRALINSRTHLTRHFSHVDDLDLKYLVQTVEQIFKNQRI